MTQTYSNITLTIIQSIKHERNIWSCSSLRRLTLQIHTSRNYTTDGSPAPRWDMRMLLQAWGKYEDECPLPVSHDFFVVP